MVDDTREALPEDGAPADDVAPEGAAGLPEEVRDGDVEAADAADDTSPEDGTDG